MQIQSKYDVIIVGGGVYGLSIAYYLSKTELEVCLLEQYTIGHHNGSSHSPSRITRSAYEKEVYRDMNLLCLRQNWPQLQKSLKQKIVWKNPFVFYNDVEESYQKYKKVAQTSENLIIMTPEEVTKKYPGMPLIKSKFNPIVDLESGMIAADVYIEKLKKYLQQCPKITICEHTTVKSINQNEKMVEIQTQTELLRAEKVVLACGRWIKQMVPEYNDLFKVTKQFMGYIQLDKMQKYQFGKFPSFGYQEKDCQYFSLPDRKGQGVKLGNHIRRDLKPEQQNIEYHYQRVRQKALQIYGEEFIKVNKIEQCYYTVCKDNDFLIDWTGPSEKIMICSCCSGHGFKFAPLIGKIITDLVTQGKSIDLFQKWSYMFKIGYHKGLNLQ